MKINLVFNGQGREPSKSSSSGGVTRQKEIIKRLSNEPNIVTWIVSSKAYCEDFKKNHVKAYYKVTPYFIRGESSVELIIDSIIRSIYASFAFFLPEDGNTIIYSPSDFLWDTLPAFVWKLRHKKSKWVVCIFLIVPSLFRDYTKSYSRDYNFSLPTFRRFFYFLSQQLTILWAKHWSHKILVLNKIDKEFLELRGVNESKLAVVSGGVDYSYIESIKTYTKIYDGVFLGRFHEQKGIFDLIKIWRLVCNSRPDAKLCIIGSGSKSLAERIKVEIIENDLTNNIELVGSKVGDEKFSILKASKIFLCPSFYESFAIVIAEAMACGLPVITYNLPIYKDIYESYISKIPLGNIPQFAKAFLEMLDNDKLRITTGKTGQKFIRKYDWVKIAQREYQLINE